jgi:hypothetical protein
VPRAQGEEGLGPAAYLVSQRDGVVGPGHDRVVVRRVGRDHHGHAVLRVHVGVNVVVDAFGLGQFVHADVDVAGRPHQQRLHRTQGGGWRVRQEGVTHVSAEAGM